MKVHPLFQKVPVVLIVLFVLSGCTTLADVKKARGEGVIGTYNADIDAVWSAVVSYINASELDLVTEDRKNGLILAQRSVNLANYGDNVAIFVESKGESRTTVEAVHKKAMQTNIFGALWAERIIEHLNGIFGS